MPFDFLPQHGKQPGRCANSSPLLVIGLLLLMLLLAACDVPPLTPTPTRIVSGPTLEASATVHILTSEELYGTSVAFGADGQNNSTSAPLPSRDTLPPVIRATAVGDTAAQIEVFLEDGTTVLGDLYSSGDALLRGPGLLLIGGEGASWGDLPQQARAAGMTVLVTPLQVRPSQSDLRDLLTSLSELPTVDPARLGVVAQGEMTDTVFVQCASQSLCGFAVLIGPRDRDTLLSAYTLYQPRPLFVVAGENNAASTTAAVALASVAPEATSRVVRLPTLSENVLTTDTTLVVDLVTWMSTTLSAVPSFVPTLELR